MAHRAMGEHVQADRSGRRSTEADHPSTAARSFWSVLAGIIVYIFLHRLFARTIFTEDIAGSMVNTAIVNITVAGLSAAALVAAADAWLSRIRKR